jgi:hypothetical protein
MKNPTPAKAGGKGFRRQKWRAGKLLKLSSENLHTPNEFTEEFRMGFFSIPGSTTRRQAQYPPHCASTSPATVLKRNRSKHRLNLIEKPERVSLEPETVAPNPVHVLGFLPSEVIKTNHFGQSTTRCYCGHGKRTPFKGGSPLILSRERVPMKRSQIFSRPSVSAVGSVIDSSLLICTAQQTES